jgi:hypothetical protein
MGIVTRYDTTIEVGAAKAGRERPGLDPRALQIATALAKAEASIYYDVCGARAVRAWQSIAGGLAPVKLIDREGLGV